MTDSDRHLDDDLRRVPLPEHLRGSLAPEALFADAPLDRLLAAVVVPDGLADRVRSAARSSEHRPRDGVLDLSRFADLGGDRSWTLRRRRSQASGGGCTASWAWPVKPAASPPRLALP